MTESQDELPAIIFSRPLPPGRQPLCMALRHRDGYETSVYVHQPADSPTHLPVLYVHGIQSHAGWFGPSARFLADHGHNVFQVHRRGSGDNVKARGHAASWRKLLDDVLDACMFVLDQTGASRLHLLGVSWGGKLLAAYAAQPGRAADIASLIMVAPGIVSRVDMPISRKLLIALCLPLAGRKLFDIPLDDVELFTGSEQMQEYLRRDPARLKRASAAFFYASRKLENILTRSPPGAIPVPTSLILAGNDRIIDNARTMEIVNRLTARKVRVHELPGRHTLEFENDPRPLYQALLDSIQRAEADPV
ncbi:MAG: alpha/beta fold hydrolase [Planctomycetes bacterium]|nr:alpha/beta fold hydrolase [Planctomycetota bacterium]